MSTMTNLEFYWIFLTGYSTLELLYRIITQRSSVSDTSTRTSEQLDWFHFRRQPAKSYIFASLWSLYILWTVIDAYFFGIEPSSRFQSIFNFVNSPNDNASDGVITGTCLATSLLTIHSFRRLYQSIYVSISSTHRTLNPLSLVVLYSNQFATGLTILAHSPALRQQPFSIVNSLHWYHLCSTVLFTGASKIQNDSLHQLTKLRRNKAGHIVTTGYKLPTGSWFDRLNISCPHFLSEILVNVAIGLSLADQSSLGTYLLLTGYVVVSHAHMAYNKQLFYRAKFKDSRRTILPGIF